MRRRGLRLALLLWALLAAAGLAVFPAAAQTDAARFERARSEGGVRLKVIGGLGGRIYQRFEEPFWTQEIPQISGGRITAEVSPSTALALSYQEILRLARLGAAPVVHLAFSTLAGDDQEAEGVDLAGLAPDAAAARRAVEAYRERLARIFRQRHGVELLAVMVYPAQVLVCAQPFASLADLKGRLIRTSSASQADMAEALGAQAITLPFRGLTAAMRLKTADCAITGAINAYLIKLHEVTSHALDLPFNWGASGYFINAAYWEGLDPAARALLRDGLSRLADRVWAEIEAESRAGMECLTSAGACPDGGGGRMTLVRASDADRAAVRQALSQTVLKRWAQRCGLDCAVGWNDTVGAAFGLSASAP